MRREGQIKGVIRIMALQAEKRMKTAVAVCLAGISVLAAAPSGAGESIPLDKLAEYYSARACVEKQYGMLDNYQADKAMQEFLNTRKDLMQSAFDTTKAKNIGIETANKIALNYYRKCSLNQEQTAALGQADQVDSERYIDVRTGHLYVKRIDGRYDEFTRKGNFFKTVPADLPLLLKGGSVYPVPGKGYLLYSKKRHLPDARFKVLPAKAPHPQGWFLETALVDFRNNKNWLDDKIAHTGGEK